MTTYEYIPIAPLEELPNGERLFVSIDNDPVVIFNIAGKLFAIRDECTHDGNPLENGPLDEHVITCPRHGAKFDVRDGSPVGTPAYQAIDSYPVRIVEGEIQLGWPEG